MKLFQLTKRFLLLTLFFQFHFCVNPELNNPCDPRSTAYRNTILTKILIADNTSFCGLRFTSGSSAQWTQEAYIKAANADVDDELGRDGVAISGDTFVIGSIFEDSNQTTIINGNTASADNSASRAGAVYVYKRTGTNWEQQAYLKAPNAGADDQFGRSVDISGDTIVVAAHVEDSNQTTITNGNTASADNSAINSGAVYVFQRTGNTWSQQAYIKASNAEAEDQFGVSVSISADTIVIGSLFEDSNQTTITNGNTASANNSVINSGAAYVFQRTGNTWSQQAYLKASNAEANDEFGITVAISVDTIVVGTLSEDSNQTTITNGNSASTDNSATNSGAAYVYKRTGTNWEQQAYLKASNADPNDQFGVSVAISGDTIVVGAHTEDSNQTTITNGNSASTDNSVINSGAAYVFHRNGNTWTQQAYLKAPNADPNDQFGRSLAISEDTIVIGSSFEDSNQNSITNGTTASSDNSAINSGAIYVFQRTGINWAQQAYIKAQNVDTDDEFGFSRFGISGNTIVVGARNEDSSQNTITNGSTASSDNSTSNSGAAYVFVRK